MLHERGTVLRVDGAHVWIACNSRADCARCASGRGCGGALWARLLGARLHEMRAARAGLNLRTGDAVLVGVDPAAVLRASLLAYLLPVLALLAGALLGRALLPGFGDAGAIAGAAVGTGFGIMSGRFLSRRVPPDPRRQPVVLRADAPGSGTDSAGG